MENVLLSQYLLLGYNQKKLSPRCVFKIDLRKTYDSMSWSFFCNLLKKLWFPSIFVQWLRACVYTASYEVLNGIPEGYI